jgi:hypothetical protein
MTVNYDPTSGCSCLPQCRLSPNMPGRRSKLQPSDISRESKANRLEKTDPFGAILTVHVLTYGAKTLYATQE